MPVGALLWGLHPWAGSQRPETVCGLRFLPRLEHNYSGRCFRLPLLDTQGKGTNMMHAISWLGVGCAGNDACPEGSLCANITRLILSEKGLSLTLKLAMKEHGKGENGTSSAG